MGAAWSGYDAKRLDEVQSHVLSLAEDESARAGRPVRFRRLHTGVAVRDAASGAVTNETVHSIECEPAAADPAALDAAPPIVLAHGYAAGSLMFTNNLANLAHHSGRRVIAVDWIGMGASSRPRFTARDENECIEWFLSSLDSWRAQRRLEQIDLVAHSMGGYLSVFYAQRHPERVRALVLASPVGFPDAPDPSARREMPWLWSLVSRLWGAGVNPNHVIRGAGPLGYRLVKRFVHRRFPEGPTLGVHGLEADNDEHAQLFSAYMHQISVAPGSGEHALGSLLLPGAFAKKPIHRELPKMPARRVLVVFGESDWMRRDIAAAHHAARQMSDAKVLSLPGTHHVYLNEAFDKAVLEHLGINEKPPSRRRGSSSLACARGKDDAGARPQEVARI